MKSLNQESREIRACRICRGADLVSILSLGDQAFTGIFPKSRSEVVPTGTLELVKCMSCGLVQLKHSFELGLLYGDNYGYRSGLNQSMIGHLNRTVAKLTEWVDLSPGDLAIDIGSNDSTLLQAYPKNLDLLGVDPTGAKFRNYYPEYIKLVPDFFSASSVRDAVGNKKAKVITSVAMFYDLEDPIQFMRDVYETLHDEGVWLFEQSYLLSMLEANAYDTICHEHLEYYALRQVKDMADAVGLRIVSVELNQVNGGSFAVTVCKKNAKYKDGSKVVSRLLEIESNRGLDDLQTYESFRSRIEEYRDKLRRFFAVHAADRSMILGYGASTKGNVILQYCGIGVDELPYIAEVNEDKFGRFTPGTGIPIISEKEAKAMRPDLLFVLPWHFKAGIVSREREYVKSGGRLVFPLPHLEVVY